MRKRKEVPSSSSSSSQLSSKKSKHTSEKYLYINNINNENNDDNDDDNDDESKDNVTLNTKILLTYERERCLQISNLITRKPEYLNEITSNNLILLAIPPEVITISLKKNKREQFDRLFALTYVLTTKWNSGNLKVNTLPGNDIDRVFEIIKSLFVKLLKLSDDELGITDDYSRYGMKKLLSLFVKLRSL